jgi:hypothetical protein
MPRDMRIAISLSGITAKTPFMPIKPELISIEPDDYFPGEHIHPAFKAAN